MQMYLRPENIGLYVYMYMNNFSVGTCVGLAPQYQKAGYATVERIDVSLLASLSEQLHPKYTLCVVNLSSAVA